MPDLDVFAPDEGDEEALRDGGWSDDEAAASVRPDEHPPAAEQHRGQLRMAERLARKYTNRLLYAHGIGWHIWDGARWARDRDGAATRAVVAIAKAAIRDLEFLTGSDKQDLFTDIKRIESAAGIKGVLEIASSLRPLTAAAERLDADPYLFNTATGTLDLRTGKTRPHDPSDLITKVAGCGLDEEAEGTTFVRFLAEILPDAEVREFVQRMLGYAMLGTVREHVLPIFTGIGKNGKTTLLDVVIKAFGDYAISAEPELLVDRGNAHPTGQADLLGARLAVCTETDKGRRLAAATVKRLTGGDKIRARRMRQDFFEFDPSHTILMVTNHKPVVSGDDPALWRRICVVPFDVVIPAEKQDGRLPERLALELSAVLAWVFQGYRAYEERGLDAPEAVTKRTDAYRVESDTIGRFLDERTYESSQAFVKARELFTAWSFWCRECGEEPGTEKAFAEAMSTRGLAKKKTAAGMAYRGFMLLADEGGGTL